MQSMLGDLSRHGGSLERLKFLAQGARLTTFHSNILKLYVKEIFDGLYKEIRKILVPFMWMLCCHLNGNSGVGKSAFLWYFRVVNREDFPQEIVLDSKVDYHLIDQKAKRTTFTRYLPAWEKHEYDALVSSWRKRVTDYKSGSEEAKEIMQRVNAAEMVFELFGGSREPPYQNAHSRKCEDPRYWIFLRDLTEAVLHEGDEALVADVIAFHAPRLHPA
ncbi:hypothetical protein SELMODRAFT_424599 [Selaginella moellendorffii]|uniref:Uncharacterized protein n=1 Tax=Selaginella moellendorffii TaxID=88036 RepID=D8SQF5_SELML|nr:hypothetical protein SELMODRAFT_424599 [Selaginella moellendorffii]